MHTIPRSLFQEAIEAGIIEAGPSGGLPADVIADLLKLAAEAKTIGTNFICGCPMERVGAHVRASIPDRWKRGVSVNVGWSFIDGYDQRLDAAGALVGSKLRIV